MGRALMIVPCATATSMFAMLFALALANSMAEGAATCTAKDMSTLIAFKGGLTADPTNTFSNWDSSKFPDCCTWNGVACDASSGRVVKLDLSGKNLEGNSIVALAKLDQLQSLDLKNNFHLKGTLDESFGDLANLQYLNLLQNGLTGTIPRSLSHLNKLTFLELGRNSFSGSLPATLGDIGPQLTYFSVGGNMLTGNIPGSLGYLSGLEYLDLVGGHPFMGFSGSIPTSFTKLLALKELRLSANQLSGSLPAGLGALTKLTHLNADNNKLSGNLPPSIGEIAGLEVLILDFNRFSGIIPPSYGLLKKLTDIGVSHNSLSGSIPEGLSKFPVKSFDQAGSPLCGKPLQPCT